MNHVVLTASISEVSTIRYTPAGFPALNLRLDHESQIEEAGHQRSVKATVKAVSVGSMAERIAQIPLGSVWQFKGFLASPRQSKNVVFHIQDFQQIS